MAKWERDESSRCEGVEGGAERKHGVRRDVSTLSQGVGCAAGKTF